MTENTAHETRADDVKPGSRFYAPSVVLLDILEEPITIPGDESSSGSVHPVHADVERASVTQLHHGVSQVSITLNNQRHERSTNSRPISPPWKYNRQDYVCFGQDLLVVFGYVQGPVGSVDSNTDEFQRNLMIRCRVTDIGYNFPSSGGAKITLQGEDALSLLNAKASENKRYRNKDEIFIVNDVLERSGSDLVLSNPEPDRRATLSGGIRSLTHRKGVSYFHFINELASRMDYEIWMDIDQFDVLHFEKSRSLIFNDYVTVTWDKDLIDFKPTFKGWDIYTSVEAAGRNSSRREAIREIVAANEIKTDLHQAPEGDAPISAMEARARYFLQTSGQAENPGKIGVTNLDAQRAKLKAESALHTNAREFLTANATTIGFPQIRPGIHIVIEGMYAPFDGVYYVTEAQHIIDGNGYLTKMKLRRPGMLDADDYPFRPDGVGS